MKQYQASFHQLKFLSLVSTIYIHSISFLNQYHRFYLEDIAGGITLWVFATMSTYFVALAGITFRISLNSDIRGGRLTRFAFGKVGNYLIVLVLVEAIKNSILIGSPVYLFHWDFLKTIFVGYVLILLLSRIHISLTWISAIALSVFVDPLTEWIRTFETLPQEVAILPGVWNEAHLYSFLLILILLILFLRATFKSKFPIPGKAVFASIGLVAAYWSWQKFLSTPMGKDNFLIIKNWLVNGLVGRSDYVVFYPLTVWLPSALIGFSLCHYALKWESFYEKNRFALMVVLAALNLTLYFHFIDSEFYKIDHLINAWDAKCFVTTNFLFELFKAGPPLLLFMILSELNRRFVVDWSKTIVFKFSISSFLIYLISTSWTVWLITQIREQVSFAIALTITLTTTMLLSWMISRVTYFFWSKRISLVVQGG